MSTTLKHSHTIFSVSEDWKSYQVYGVTLTSNFPFRNHLKKSTQQPDLTFSCTLHPPTLEDLEKQFSPPSGDDEECGFRLLRRPNYDVLHFQGSADYYIWEDQIICHLLDIQQIHWVEIGLLGAVLSFWFDRQGLPALHASAVVVQEQVLGFLAHSFTGKSSLAATFQQGGYPIFTDDVMPVDPGSCPPIGRPGYPQMRLWPDQVHHFIGDHEKFDLVHPDYSKRRIPLREDDANSFCHEPRPIGCLYLPERRDPDEWNFDIEITSVSCKEATRELIRHSFMSNLLDAGDLQPQRLQNLIKLAQQIPMRRLVYPSGLEHLPRVRDAVLDDFFSNV